jgi:hypothetical protein
MSKGKPTLKWDLDNGEGSIGNLDSFRQELDPLMRLDLLKDWVDLLDEEYDRALKDFAAWGEKIRVKAGHPPGSWK